MLASSSLASAARILTGTPATDAAAPGGEAAAGFAALLDRLAAIAAGSVLPGEAPAAASATNGLQAAANPARAAKLGGKDLPVALPEATEQGDATAVAPRSDAEGDPAEAAAIGEDILALLAAPVLPAHPQPTTEMPLDQPKPARAPQAPAAQVRVAIPDGALPSAQADAAKTEAPAVTLTVAPAGAKSGETADPASAASATPIKAKTSRAADLPRSEAPAAPSFTPPAPAVADARQPAHAAAPAAPHAPVPLPSAADMTAALDKLVAAREALMPAAAALAIDHAEFGEVRIRFEQSSDGRLSAELAAADPELHRAVTAAVAADRGAAAGSDGDSGRFAHPGSQRSATGSGDAASGERSQPGSDRELPQRRSSSPPDTRRAPADQGPGIFA